MPNRGKLTYHADASRTAFVTFGLANDGIVPSAAATVLGLLFTRLTIVDAILKPGKRFAASARHGIAPRERKRGVDIRAAASAAADEKAFHALIQAMDGRLAEIGGAMAAGGVPKAAERAPRGAGLNPSSGSANSSGGGPGGWP